MLAEAVEVESAAFEPNFGGLLFAKLILAQCVRDEGKPDEARRTYLDAIASATHPTGPRGDLLMDYGVFLMIQDDWEGAIKQLRLALADRELVYGPTSTRAIETRHRIADSLSRIKRIDAAIEHLDEGIALCEKADATPLAYPELYQIKGHILMWNGRPQQGHEVLLRALELHRKIKTPAANHYDTLISLGEVERRLGKLDPAIEHLQLAMTLRTLEGQPVYHAVAAFRLGQTLWQKGRAHWPQGCEAARRAYSGFSAPFGGSNDPELAETRKLLAKLRCSPPAS